MRIYDVSVGISPALPVWPGDPSVELERVQSMDSGDHANVSRIACSVHSGTHVDAPVHFVARGKGVESLPLKILTGRAYVLSLPRAKTLDAETLEGAKLPPRTRRVLFKTRNSGLWSRGEGEFQQDYVALTESGAQWLVRKGVHLVGIDYLSIAPFREGGPTHRVLLGAGVVVVEGLNLSDVSQGRYTLYCLPLKLVGSDGAPARVILVGV
ncbi:MAG TPA: cyclase family protein [Anaerolineales bacterium]|nr:cyclase family protein [Anaerolineales bacterium]